MKRELWRDIPGYEGYYEASNLGKVRSIERKIPIAAIGKKPYIRIKRSFILKPTDTGQGMSVTLSKNKKTPRYSLSKLVLSAFGYNNKYTYHIDGNYKNCALDNLIVTLYTEEEVLKMLEKLRSDCVYCFGDGVRFIKVEDYLIKK